jgi:hypothetical protein
MLLTRRGRFGEKEKSEIIEHAQLKMRECGWEEEKRKEAIADVNAWKCKSVMLHVGNVMGGKGREQRDQPRVEESLVL